MLILGDYIKNRQEICEKYCKDLYIAERLILEKHNYYSSNIISSYAKINTL